MPRKTKEITNEEKIEKKETKAITKKASKTTTKKTAVSKAAALSKTIKAKKAASKTKKNSSTKGSASKNETEPFSHVIKLFFVECRGFTALFFKVSKWKYSFPPFYSARWRKRHLHRTRPPPHSQTGKLRRPFGWRCFGRGNRNRWIFRAV